jgi:hypothetical protein
MALLTSEIARIRYELGYGNTQIANPYLTTYALFETVIQQYMQAGASTTSSTSVTEAANGAFVALTLASATGFNAGDAVIVDVDDVQERATIRSIAGAAITVFLKLAHSGTYPVTIEGGEAIVREILRQLRLFSGGTGEDGLVAKAATSAGIKKVDEIEFFGNAFGEKGQFKSVVQAREYFRDELASALGVVNLRKMRAGNGDVVVV